jgi:hypothetical protein
VVVGAVHVEEAVVLAPPHHDVIGQVCHGAIHGYQQDG